MCLSSGIGWRQTKLKPKQNKRTIEEINEKIRKGDAQVLTAEEMKKLVESSSIEVAFKEVDVVTTGTFGAMCSSGAIINIGHSDPHTRTCTPDQQSPCLWMSSRKFFSVPYPLPGKKAYKIFSERASGRINTGS